MDIADQFSAGAAAQLSGRWLDAETIYREILDRDPSSAMAHYSLANALSSTGRMDDAEVHFRIAAQAAPKSPAPRYGLSQVLLALGRYREAQPYLESRHDLPQLKVPRVPYPQPRWTGEPLDGKRLLIFPEQGLGDQIMMARFAPRLQAMGADVTLLCSPPLADLFTGLGVRIVPAAGAASFPKPDYWTTVMGLPGLMGLEGDQVVSDPYLVAPEGPDLGPGFHVGVVTSGNPAHSNDRARSLRAAEANRLHSVATNVHDLAQREGRSLSDLAALISKLDLIITVDTAAAHLAGALGKPVWVLLPYVKTDWRWGARGSVSTPWHQTARLFWSAPDGSWDAALSEIESAVREATAK